MRRQARERWLKSLAETPTPCSLWTFVRGRSDDAQADFHSAVAKSIPPRTNVSLSQDRNARALPAARCRAPRKANIVATRKKQATTGARSHPEPSAEVLKVCEPENGDPERPR